MSKWEMRPTRKGLSLPLSVAQVFFFTTCVVMSQILLMEFLATPTEEEEILTRGLVSDNPPRTDSGTRGLVSENSPRTAVVYLTRALDECRAMRLGHLLQTVPPNMDVWLLHNHNLMNNGTKLITSINHVRRLEREHILYNQSQANELITEFDDPPSGAAKSSFLRWVVAHPEYKHAWHMEDDIFFTGKWSHFFAQADKEADFIGAKFERINGWEYFRGTRCSMDQTYIPSYIKKRSNITVNGRIMCRDVLTWRTLWCIARFSTQFAQFLLDDILSGTLQGHHEGVVHGVLMGHENLTFSDLPPISGYYKSGGWGNFKNRSYCSLDTYQPINDNRYYHPVKCDAYTGERLDYFKEILMTYGWSNSTLPAPDLIR
jgi:hypothetical protein